MGILDKLKKNKKEKVVLRPAQGKKEKKEVAAKEAQVFTISGKGSGFSVISEPHISEKATILENQSQYIFKVKSEANKIQIRRALKDLYNVDVKQVRIINTKGKKRVLGRIQGFASGFKKAIVKLKEGQKIELLPK